MVISVVTYNVLATAYIRPTWYPHTPAPLLEAKHRVPELAAHLATLDADLLCLQEVEEPVMDALRGALIHGAYRTAALLPKHGDKPDGCACFVKDGTLSRPLFQAVTYPDEAEAQPRSGHVALVVACELAGRCLAIANTHLKWDPPGAPADRQYGLRQIRHLLAVRDVLVPEAEGWILCGDLNATLDSPVVEALFDAGFAPAPPAGVHAPTANPNGRAKRIDWLFHDAALTAEPLPLPLVEDETPLPGPGQPSDHVAVAARVSWHDVTPAG